MKTHFIFGLIIVATLALASCTNTPTRNAPTTPLGTSGTKIPVSMPTMSGKNHGSMDMGTMSGMDHGSMDMGTSSGSMMHMGASSEEEFLVNMIPHHQEAIDSAKIIMTKTKNPELKKIAEAIISGQSTEVNTMKKWLKTWYPNTTMKTEYMPMMRNLSKLSEHDMDDAFMTDMIKHHEGAIHMAEEVLDITQRPEIVKIAKDIVSAQKTEIATFQKMLSDH